ncbi:hypothetical protein RE628_04850 [Paenibacillus sp. D2_2]|uniref:hypothetical protein n=1 Tax=Paenibacillus sp. D2_2 TaxID=3073092 RepID=UPI0028152C85|nr:hypothetical protein [Paenibacillus sp. D2_2]WMT41799.1 hypothetical protein RE628_04850 [Paenibacillus sp. D2_2]
MTRKIKSYVPLSSLEFNTITELFSKLLYTQHPPVIIPGKRSWELRRWRRESLRLAERF